MGHKMSWNYETHFDGICLSFFEILAIFYSSSRGAATFLHFLLVANIPPCFCILMMVFPERNSSGCWRLLLASSSLAFLKMGCNISQVFQVEADALTIGFLAFSQEFSFSIICSNKP